jgi:predicted membrane channel-forming protein YqfA (hemolysin III family)
MGDELALLVGNLHTRRDRVYHQDLQLYSGVFGFHEIWHIFVMLAAGCFVAVLGVV